MFIITAFPLRDPMHVVTQEAPDENLLELWRNHFAEGGWVVKETIWSDLELLGKFICSACTWRGNYPDNTYITPACPACLSAIRRVEDYDVIPS